MRRPGRLDKEIELGVPSALDRESILATILRSRGVVVDGCTEDGAQAQAQVESLSRPTVPHTTPGIVNADDGKLNRAPETETEIVSMTSSTSLTCSDIISMDAVRKVARQAHGMVGSDLLLVVKEAFFAAMERSLSSNGQSHAAVGSSRIIDSASGIDSITEDIGAADRSRPNEGSCAAHIISSDSDLDSTPAISLASEFAGMSLSGEKEDFAMSPIASAPAGNSNTAVADGMCTICGRT